MNEGRIETSWPPQWLAPMFSPHPFLLLSRQAPGPPMSQPKLESEQEVIMLAAIGAVLLILCLFGFLALHVTFGAVHLLLVIAVNLLVMHFLTGRGSTV
jgi:hypothetical protein